MSLVRAAVVPLARLQLPPDFEQIAQEPLTALLAESIRINGLLQRPCVEDGTFLVICGVRRIAALVSLGELHVPVDVHDLGRDRAQLLPQMRLAENLHRWGNDRPSLAAEYVAARAAKLEGHKAPLTETRRAVAEELGTTLAALRQVAYRARKRKAKQDGQPSG